MDMESDEKPEGFVQQSEQLGNGLSKKAEEELTKQAKNDGWDLLHDLMLKDIVETSDDFYLEREPGDIGYNRFIGTPNLSEIVVSRFIGEIGRLSPAVRKEVIAKLMFKFPRLVDKINDITKKWISLIKISSPSPPNNKAK